MRHRRNMRKLTRTTEHTLALIANLACSLIEHNRIKTTVAKAKALRPFVEKLVTKARRGTLHDRRVVAAKLGNNSRRVEKVVRKLFTEIAPLNASRPGGYTRILKLGRRLTDSAPMALIEFVEFVASTEATPEPTPAKAKKGAKESKETKETAEAKPAKKKAPAKETEAAEAPEAEATEEKKPAAKKPRAKKTESKEE
jgi:large subunit ribosomal protein L17